MSEVKTKPTQQSPLAFFDTLTDVQKREDSRQLLAIFADVTGQSGVMWGTSIVGFGEYVVKSNRRSEENVWPLTAFSPRKQSLTLYIMTGNERSKNLLLKLGKYKVSGSCLHIRRLSDIDEQILRTLIKNSYSYMAQIKNIS